MLPFLVPALFAFYIQGVLKFKCQIPVPKSCVEHAHWSFDSCAVVHCAFVPQERIVNNITTVMEVWKN
jgi:hypothetical protein